MACLLTGCGTGIFSGNVYRDTQTAYRLGSLPAHWHRIGFATSNVTYRRDAGGALLANSVCNPGKDMSLDVLTNQVLFGFEEKLELSREPFTLDGRSALRTRVRGTLDGVPVMLELLVLKKDECVYDFQLVAAPGTFPALIADFDALVAGFHVLPGRRE